MTKEEIIRNLKYTMEKHKNDTVNTFDTNISLMCKDILDYLEQEPALDKIRADIEQMDFDFGDFYDHTNTIIEMVLAIIDKYKAESEE